MYAHLPFCEGAPTLVMTCDCGLQGGVYDLVDSQGKKLDMVLKIVHQHAPLAEVEREVRGSSLVEGTGPVP
jgi:hypothetical protein